MKEHIYTIPLNEAMDAGCDCPLCRLEQQMEDDAVSYCLGGAMMEPDFRTKSNLLGYCKPHYQKMLAAAKRLPLALILQTHLQHQTQQLSRASGGVLPKSGKDVLKLCEKMKEQETACVVCARVEKHLADAADNFVALWQREADFRKKVENSSGVCLPHLSLLLCVAAKNLNKADLSAFSKALYGVTLSAMEKAAANIDWFCKKFDYRFADQPWNGAEDAPERAIGLLSKYIK